MIQIADLIDMSTDFYQQEPRHSQEMSYNMLILLVTNYWNGPDMWSYGYHG